MLVKQTDGQKRIDSSVRIEMMGAEEFDSFWPEISVSLDRIAPIWSERWTKDAMYLFVVSGQWQAWSVGVPPRINVIVLTHFLQYPNVRALQAVLCFGSGVKKVLSVGEAFFEQIAAHNDCGLLEIVGRRGWKKMLPNFREESVILTKRVGKMVEH